jgi:hypothetical protein
MTTVVTSLDELEAAEFRLVDALSNLSGLLPPQRSRMKARVLDTLAKVRAKKAAFLADHPDVLRKSATRPIAAPSWRGLPVDNIAAEVFAKEARSRAAETARLAKRAGEQTSQPAIDLLKRSLRAPAATGNAGCIAFLAGRAGR